MCWTESAESSCDLIGWFPLASTLLNFKLRFDFYQTGFKHFPIVWILDFIIAKVALLMK